MRPSLRAMSARHQHAYFLAKLQSHLSRRNESIFARRCAKREIRNIRSFRANHLSSAIWPLP